MTVVGGAIPHGLVDRASVAGQGGGDRCRKTGMNTDAWTMDTTAASRFGTGGSAPPLRPRAFVRRPSEALPIIV